MQFLKLLSLWREAVSHPDLVGGFSLIQMAIELIKRRKQARQHHF